MSENKEYINRLYNKEVQYTTKNYKIHADKHEHDIIELTPEYFELVHTIATLHKYYDMSAREMSLKLDVELYTVNNILKSYNFNALDDMEKFIVKYDTEIKKGLDAFNTKYNKCLTVE